MVTRIRLSLIGLLCVLHAYSQSGNRYRIWFDHNEATAQTGSVGVTQTLELDVSMLSEGMHTLSLALLAEDGRVTSMRNSYFVRIKESDNAVMRRDVKCYYCFDHSTEYVEARSMGGGNYALNIDASGLSEGMHQVSVRLVAADGQVVSLRNSYFVRIKESDNAMMRRDVKCYYCFDHSEEYIEAQSMGGGTYALNFDVAGLKRGMHLVSMRLVAADGQVVSLRNSYFVKIESEGQGIAGYEYWVNGEIQDKVRVKLSQGAQKYLLAEDLQLPTIPFCPAKLKIAYEDGQPYAYNENVFHIRFFSTDNLDVQDTATYIDMLSRQAITGEALEAGETIAKAVPETDGVLWYYIDAMADDSVALKTDLPCTLQIFSPDGKELYKAIGTAATGFGGCRVQTPGIYYVALHSVDNDGEATELAISYALDEKQDNVKIDIASNQWRFLCLPFDVGLSEIEREKAATQFSVRYYDGAGRAEHGIGDNWKRVAQDGVIAAGTGFILQHNGADVETFTFTSCGGDIDTTSDVIIPLQDYPSEWSCNAGWNLIGNPYPTYYNMENCDFAAPVTIWNGDGYDAYRPHDDEVVLHPFEAFFVQRQDREAITFTAQAPSPVPPRGEAVTNDSGKRSVTAKSSTSLLNPRTIINLSVHALPHGEGRGGGFEGQVGGFGARTRIVLNDLSSRDYEPECDAAKFFGGSIDLYTVEHGTAYAINERPLDDGIVSVGFSCAEAGTYTITADRPVMLVDKQLGTTAVLGIDEGGYAVDGTPTLASDTDTTPAFTSYTFTAPAGNIASRFELRLGNVTGLPTIAAQSDANAPIYTLSGVRVVGKPTRKGVYIRGGHKVMF